jgi:hypothetical protein
MELEYYKVQKYEKGLETCKYNDACRCDRYQRMLCNRCGWNPKVAQARNERIFGKGDKVGV